MGIAPASIPVERDIDVPLPGPDHFGRLFARTSPDGSVQAMPVRALDVRARIDGLVSLATVTTRFGNVFTQPLRATYIFPLPWDGAVTRFTMRVAGRTVLGKVFARAEAIERHERALDEGKTSSLLEEDLAETFTLEVGNIPPGEDVEIEIRVVAPVPVAAGRATWRFPLVCGEKYIPGRPLGDRPVGSGTSPDTDVVPGGSRVNPPRLAPGEPNPIALSLDVTFARGDLADSASLVSTIPVVPSGTADGVRVVLGDLSQDPDRDLVLRWDLPRAVAGDLAVAEGPDGKHYFLATVVAPLETGGRQRPPKDVVLLVDRSGSMGGWKIESARRVAERLLRGLREGDRFNVIAFDDRFEAAWGTAHGPVQLVPANQANIVLAQRFVGKLDARGGTELGQLLGHAMRALAARETGRDASILLVTDAQVGDEHRILAAARAIDARASVYAVGVDTSLNAGLLGQLARETGGQTVQVTSRKDETEALELVAKMFDEAALRDVRLACPDGRVDKDSFTPARIPALQPSVPLLVAGRFAGKPKPLVVTASAPDGGNVTLALAPRPGEPGLVVPTWAHRHLRDLETAFHAASRGRDGIEKRILKTSIEHQVLSTFTAYLAIDEESRVVGDSIDVTQRVSDVPMVMASTVFYDMDGGGGPVDTSRLPLRKLRDVMPSAPMQPVRPDLGALLDAILKMIDAFVDRRDELARALERLLHDLDPAHLPDELARALHELLAFLQHAPREIELPRDVIRRVRHELDQHAKGGRRRSFWRR